MPLHDEMYASMGAISEAGDETLRQYVASMADMFAQVDAYISDDDETGHEGWGKLLDASVVPEEALPWLAQVSGVEFPPGLSVSEQREYLQTVPNQRRGTIPTMRAAVQHLLTGNKFVSVIERDSSPWRITFNTRTSETPDPDAVLAALTAPNVKPAGLIVGHQTITGADFQTLKETYNTFNDLKNSG